MPVPANILWVDDQIDRYQPWMTTFGQHGTKVDPSDSLAEGLRKLEHQQYDVVLLDLMMGHESCIHILGEFYAKARGAKLFVCSSFFYLTELMNQFIQQQREMRISIGRVDKTHLPFTDDSAATIQFLQELNADDSVAVIAGAVPQAPEQHSLAGTDTAVDLSAFPTLDEYLELSTTGKIAALRAAAQTTKLVRQEATRAGYRYLLFCGSWAEPLERLHGLDNIPNQEQVVERARTLGYAPFVFTSGGRVDDLSSGCSDKAGLLGYPTLRLTYRSNSEEIHFDTGNPYTLLSYEWYLEKGWLPVSRMFDMHTAGELELVGNHFRFQDVIVTDASGETVNVTAVGFAATDWNNTRLASRCDTDCTNPYAQVNPLGTCRFRTGLLGRNLARAVGGGIHVNCMTGKCFFVEDI